MKNIFHITNKQKRVFIAYVKGIINASLSKKMAVFAFFGVINMFQLAIAAAPSEPISPTQENLVQATSINAQSLLENNYRTITATLTGYSSTADQTDDTPWVTASNTRTREGVVAANFLAFGTQIMIPKLFGDKIFTVEDRMASRFDNRVDIWFPDRQTAKHFGITKAKILVLN